MRVFGAATGGLALAVALLLPLKAFAEKIVHSGEVFRWEISDPVPVGNGSEDLVAMTLSIRNISGDMRFNPRAFVSRGSGLAGITGQLHQQRGIFAGGQVVVSSVALDSVFSTPIDSHFLVNLVDILVGPQGDPVEDYGAMESREGSDATVSADNAEVSFGTTLGMTAVLTGEVGVLWHLAYLVVPDGSRVGVQAEVGGGVSGAAVRLEQAEFEFVVPEPASIAVLGVGCLVLLSRRSQPV